jgi:hypothetical protein
VSDLIECPTCGQHTFECVTDGEMTNFLCLNCHMCWHVELGYVSHVDPQTCPGCHNYEDCMRRARVTETLFEALDPANELSVRLPDTDTLR